MDTTRQISLRDFQQRIREMYFEKDQARGIDGTFMWLMEEVGELAAALREGTHEDQLEEFADVLAWLVSLASIVGIDVAHAATFRYADGCPKCGASPCAC